MCSRGGKPGGKPYRPLFKIKKGGLNPKGKKPYEDWEGDNNDVPMEYLYSELKKEVSTVLCPYCTSHEVSEMPDTFAQFCAGKKKCMTCGRMF
ncbi:MAG: hypothetical protein COW88_01450 [Candidatus Lloydbacteria bacterium CG22_combo_CG10-13_8_21_14_all_47_15]|uniref:Uncharacterized protein n=1 Tax=Candidatus Lloydbacteria bacterium CG22_combo_CG10-13_8_21_14_all_47_15 TaxID=1974635 RepID=A0A2H0CUI1_9BACT|nr:MAG: hypothetical protein COW88_01450 [Candidatus Lloydbacteria bacterium CG22_combo_CG10-13_8_21_14_all_47_15]